jgi:hypothetical protein
MGLSDESMRDKIEDIIEDNQSGRDNYISARVLADDIIEALPSMVKPLVWVHSYYGEHMHDTKCKYEIKRHDSGGRLWRLTKGVTGGGAYIGHYPSAAIAQAAADKYRADDVMAAFTGETQ